MTPFSVHKDDTVIASHPVFYYGKNTHTKLLTHLHTYLDYILNALNCLPDKPIITTPNSAHFIFHQNFRVIYIALIYVGIRNTFFFVSWIKFNGRTMTEMMTGGETF